MFKSSVGILIRLCIVVPVVERLKVYSHYNRTSPGRNSSEKKTIVSAVIKIYT